MRTKSKTSRNHSNKEAIHLDYLFGVDGLSFLLRPLGPLAYQAHLEKLKGQKEGGVQEEEAKEWCHGVVNHL